MHDIFGDTIGDCDCILADHRGESRNFVVEHWLFVLPLVYDYDHVDTRHESFLSTAE